MVLASARTFCTTLSLVRWGRSRVSWRMKKKWPWIVAATAVVVAGGVTAGVILSQRSKGGDEPAGAVTVNW